MDGTRGFAATAEHIGDSERRLSGSRSDELAPEAGAQSRSLSPFEAAVVAALERVARRDEDCREAT
jgi:hypothetical protein